MRGADHKEPRQPRHHVAIFLPSLAGGGAERVLLTLAGRFASTGVRVDLVLVREEGEWLGSVPQGINLIPLHRHKTRSAVFALASYLRRNRPETLLSSLYRNNIVAIGAARLSMQRVRVVIREANRTDLLIGAIARSRLRAKLDLFYLRRAYPRADAIIAVSNGVRDGMVDQRFAPRVPIHVIPNPLSAAILHRPHADRAAIPMIVACGRLSREKDHATLLRAFALLRRRMPARLTILGEGPERCRLESLAHELGLTGDVALPGFVADPIPYMRDASVFVHTSLFEGLPNVLLQALASGCPIVATDCPGGVRDALAHGKFGTLVKVGDAATIAKAVAQILSGNERFPNPDDFLKTFNMDSISKKYLSVLFPTRETRNGAAR